MLETARLLIPEGLRQRELFFFKEVRLEILRVSSTTFKRLIKRKALAVVTMPGTNAKRIPKESVVAYLAAGLAQKTN